jgi:hypothetical protein
MFEFLSERQCFLEKGSLRTCFIRLLARRGATGRRDGFMNEWRDVALNRQLSFIDNVETFNLQLEIFVMTPEIKCCITDNLKENKI